MENIKYSYLKGLEVIHILEYYDFPLFFISKSPKDEYLLNYYVEETKENIDKWLFSRISSKELKDLIEQRLSVLSLLNRLFNKKRLYHLYIDSTITEPEVKLNMELIDTSNFDPESFPEEDFFVEYDYVTKQNLVKIEHDLIDSSRFKLVLKDIGNSHDINLDLFLDVLGNLKKSINGIAHDVGSKIIGEESIHQINLRIDSLQPSSFGIWLVTEPLDVDLFEVPEKSLNNLFELIGDIEHKNSNEIEEQIEIDEKYSLESIKNIKNMLKNIAENHFSFELQATTKSEKVLRQVKFDKNSYNKLDILNNILHKKSVKYTEKIDIEGILTSVNTTNNHFRITTTTIGDISGKMSKEMFESFKNDQTLKFRVPSIIKATIKKEIIKDYVEDENSIKYILIHFEQPE